jgi:NAD(P)-dependent dehydrogenase (short-subunit alcohol dehydrogenase family)
MTKTVLITGCSSGFGKAAATKFHDGGWNVVATMRDPDVADAILESVNDETGQLRWIVGADQAERMHMRHETSEAEYNDWTWHQFGPR